MIHGSGEGNEITNEALKICATLEIKDLCGKFRLQTGRRTIYGVIKVNRKSYVKFEYCSNHCSLASVRFRFLKRKL